MAQRTVTWTRTADIQYAGILEYWVSNNKSTTYSKKLVKLVSDRTRQIAQSPFAFKAVEFPDTRVASLGNFSVFYKVYDKEILITAFWDNRQDPSKLLEVLKHSM
jgi:plasmid stabilization system protein ParE